MWKQIIGHDASVAPLQRAAQTGVIAQAYLLAGPQGVGKSLIAQTLVMASLCTASNKPCGVCATCQRILSGQHPDVIDLRVLPDKSEIGIEQWRSVEAKVQFQALEGDRKFIIIDDAERMSMSVANACLKTLEEPPANTHFVLIAHDADRLLPTIRSRCQQLVFSPLPHAVVESWLVKQGSDAAVAKRVAGLSQGSLQRAQRLAKPEVLSVLDVVTRDMQKGFSPLQVLSHAATLAVLPEAPEVLDGLAVAVRNMVVTRPSARSFQWMRSIEQTGMYMATKGANKELLLNELFISLSS